MDINSVVRKMPGVFQLLGLCFAFYKQHYRKFLLLACLPVGAGLLNLFVSPLMSTGYVAMRIIGVILGIVIGIGGVLVQFLFPYILIRFTHGADTGKMMPFKELAGSTLKLFWPLLWVSVLMGLATLGAMVFLIIPGIILAVFLTYSMYVVALEDKRGLSVLTMSFQYVKGNWWRVFGRSLALGALGLLCMIVLLGLVVLVYYICGGSFGFEQLGYLIESKSLGMTIGFGIIGLIVNFIYWAVMYPIVILYSYYIYKHLKSNHVPLQPKQEKTARGWFMGLSIFGIVVPGLLVVISLVGVILVSLNTARSLGQQAQQSAEMKEYDYYAPLFPEVAIPFPTPDMSLLKAEPVTNTLLHFKVNIPKGWTVYDDAESAVINPELGNNVVEASYWIEPVDLYLDDLRRDESIVAEDVAELALEYSKDLKNLEFKKYKLGNRNVYSVSGTYVDTASQASYSEFYIIIDTLQAYVMTFRSAQDDLAAARRLVESSIATFVIVK